MTGADLFRIYCFPGRIITRLNYLFPNKYMDAVRSRRQLTSTFSHFYYSSLLYFCVIGGAVFIIYQAK